VKVFCDTNVLVAAFVSRGLCADLLRAVLTHEELVTGEVVLDELTRVLWEKLKAPEELVDLALDLLRRHTVVARPGDPWPGPVGDPDDAWVLASALAAGAGILVTGDSDLLDLEPIPEIRILSPRELWQTLASRNEGESEGKGDDESEYPLGGGSTDGGVMEPGFRPITSHEDLEVYRLAYRAAREVFDASKGFPPEERYSLTDQVRRSSRSVCANLAEAWRKRRYRAVFQLRLNDCEAEAAETRTWIHFARDCGYLNEEGATRLLGTYDHIIRMLVTMVNHPDPWILPTKKKT